MTSVETEPTPPKMSLKAKLRAGVILAVLATPIVSGFVIGRHSGSNSEKHKNAQELATARGYRDCVSYFGKLAATPPGTKIKINSKILDKCSEPLEESPFVDKKIAGNIVYRAASDGYTTEEHSTFSTNLGSPHKLEDKATALEHSGAEFSHWGDVNGAATGVGIGLSGSIALLSGLSIALSARERRREQPDQPLPQQPAAS